MKKVYIAGPYTKGDVSVNVRNAILAADAVREMGFTPFIPHLTHFWHVLTPHEYTFWLQYDLEWLRCCNYLIRLPGESNGADKEVREAGQLGILCVDGVENFRRLVAKQ